MKRTLVLAFDIERAGGRFEHDIVGLGASVVSNERDHEGRFIELDSLYVKAYLPEHTHFEERCKQEFWDLHPEKLAELKVDKPISRKKCDQELVDQFIAFRRKWEERAHATGDKLELVSDNNVYDGGFMNQLICEYTSLLPLPYTTSGKYRPFWETHSEQRGLLMAVDPDFKKDHGYTERIYDLFDVPRPKVAHDHNPAHDAYTIACEHQVLLGIRDGRIRKRKRPAAVVEKSAPAVPGVVPAASQP